MTGAAVHWFGQFLGAEEPAKRVAIPFRAADVTLVPEASVWVLNGVHPARERADPKATKSPQENGNYKRSRVVCYTGIPGHFECWCSDGRDVAQSPTIFSRC